MSGYSIVRKIGGILCVGAALCGVPALAYADTAPTDSEPAPSGVQTDSSSASGPFRQKGSGFALIANFSSRLFMIDASGGNNTSQTALQGGIFGGFKTGRLLIGLGFDLSNFDTEVQFKNGADSSKSIVSNTGFLFSPGMQIALLRSADQRVELIGAFQLGLGSIIKRNVQDPELPKEDQSENNQHNFYLQYRIAPGLRVWALPQLAFNLLTGLSGDHLFLFQNNPSGNRSDQRATTAFFLNLGAMGVF